jgi:DNA-binding CsgD family transcriptional regulator
MDTKKPTITPVNREDFDLHFGRKKGLSDINLEVFFAPAINQFKKLAVGRYCWFIADAEKGIPLFAGGMFEKIVPIKIEDFVNHSPEILFKNAHPEDIMRLFAFTNHWISFFMSLTAERKMNVRPTIYIRLLSPGNLYKWVMIQYAEHLLDADGNIAYGLTLITDISHIKKDGVAMMSVLDTSDESCQLFFCADGKAIAGMDEPLPKISQREIEVLRLLAAGNSSKQIAAELNIAIKTIDNHRQNLLLKTKTKSSAELVAYGINMGFI